MKAHLIVVGPVPPPIHGESIAISQLIHSKAILEKYDVEVIDTGRGKNIRGGRFSIIKLCQDIRNFLVIAHKIKKSHDAIVYLSLSQTKLGLLRDVMVIRLVRNRAGKVIAHLHGNHLKMIMMTINPWMAKIVSNALRKIDSGIVLSQALSSNFMNLPRKIDVVSNGIDQDMFSSLIIKHARIKRRAAKTFHILYLSNLIQSKGFGDVILTAIELLKKKEDIKLTLAGQIYDCHLFNQLFRKVTEYGFESKITYIGIATGVEKKKILLEAHVMVLPTQYPIEGQPISIIEGMAAGLPIISTAQGAIPDMIDGSGIVVDQVDPEHLACAIKQLIDNRSLYERLSEHSRSSFLKKFTLDHYIDELISVFERGIPNEQKNHICH
ncbi:glycosyltransferase family 4 protein [Sporolactobacillus shoreicorticis]|uniref:Glycosyltransferase family 4 protein n=1 Tax=Sporolactobacillus shoreicorticis TaxID=1923877 RepID=A0ABW5S3G5_9BACL|nr:glycosyltransferase family 4 protein [Sporolactobacillus shoreicorticis]MCO7124206.1 glycosyltransferase family 4 protein [Sporolactobacillus shoreicorticis]